MAVRRERVELDLQTNFPRVAAEAAAALRLLNEEVERLGKGSKTNSTKGLERDVDNLSRKTERGASSLDRYTGRLSAMAAATAALGPGLIPIGAVGIPAIAGLASSFGFATLAAGTMIGAFQGVGGALDALNKAKLEPTTENLQAAREAMSQISPAARDFTRELSSLEPALKGLRDTAAEGLFPGLTEGLDQMRTALPVIQRIVGAVSGELGDLAAAGGESLAGPRWTAFFKFLGDEAPQALADMAHGVGNVAHAMAQLWMAFAPLNRGFSSWIVDATEKFDTWASHLSATNGFQDFIAYIQKSGPEVGAALGAIANAVLQIVEAAAPLGGPVLKTLTAVAEAIASVADSDLGTPIFTAIAALSVYNRGLALTSKLSQTSFGSRVKGQLTGYSAALLHVTTAEERASRSVAQASLVQRERFSTLARGTGQMALLGTAASGLADKFGLANTASLALAGSLIEPGLGTAVGATAGLFLDAKAAGDGFGQTLDRLDAAAKGNSIAEINKQLAAAHKQVKDINDSSGVKDYFSDIGKTNGASVLRSIFPGSTLRDHHAEKSIKDAEHAKDLISLAAATRAQGAALTAAANGYQLTAAGAAAAAGGIRAFTAAATAANAAISKRSDFDAYKSALLDARDALKQNGATLSANTRAGLANRAALRSIASGAVQAASGMKDFGRQTKFLTGARRNFIQLATSMGMPRKAAAQLATQLGLVARIKARPTVVVQGVPGAVAQVRALRAQLAGLHDKTIHVQSVFTKAVSDTGRGPAGVTSAYGNIFFANGGFGDVANRHMPELYRGRKTRIWGEPETRGEAYIPLANDDRRPRAMSIAERTVGILGGDVSWNAQGHFALAAGGRTDRAGRKMIVPLALLDGSRFEEVA